MYIVLILIAAVLSMVLLTVIALTLAPVRRALLAPRMFPHTAAWGMRLSGRMLQLGRFLRLGDPKNAPAPELIEALCSTRASNLEALRDDYHALDALPTVQQGLQALNMKSVFDVFAKPVYNTASPYTDPLQKPPMFIPGVPAHTFYDPAEFEFTARLEAAYPQIRAELDNVLAHQRDKFQMYRGGQGNKHEGWNNFFFYLFGKRNDEYAALCPVTTSILDSMPRLERTMAMFAALNPHSGLPPHTGPFNGVLRVHLPLIVPPKCTVTVGGESRHWEEGKVMVFDDSYVHSVQNDSDSVRVVLFFSVYHPVFNDAEVPVVERFNDAWQTLPVTRLWEKMQHDTTKGRVVMQTPAAQPAQA